METLSPFQATWYPRVLGLLRIVSGYLFIAHGTAKLLKVPHVAMFDKLERRGRVQRRLDHQAA